MRGREITTKSKSYKNEKGEVENLLSFILLTDTGSLFYPISIEATALKNKIKEKFNQSFMRKISPRQISHRAKLLKSL